MDGTITDIQEAQSRSTKIRDDIKNTINVIAEWDSDNISSAGYAAVMDTLSSLYEELKTIGCADSTYQDGFEAGYTLGWIDCEKKAAS